MCSSMPNDSAVLPESRYVNWSPSGSVAATGGPTLVRSDARLSMNRTVDAVGNRGASFTARTFTTTVPVAGCSPSEMLYVKPSGPWCVGRGV